MMGLPLQLGGAGCFRAASQKLRAIALMGSLLTVTVMLAACGGRVTTGGSLVSGPSTENQVVSHPGSGAVASSATWVGPLVKVHGTIYLLSKEPPVEVRRLDAVVARVKRTVSMETGLQDGDSNFLPVGSKIYAIQGVDVAEAVAAEYQGQYVLLKPNLRPGAIGSVAK